MEGESEHNEQRAMKIGQVARELNISVETIRMYETAGLILPEKTGSGQRLFDVNDVFWLNCIRRLIKEQGMNLEGIRRLLALMPCWNIKPCTAKDQQICPAVLKAEQPCWAMKEQLPPICKTANCRECAVYQSASKCTNLKTLLYGIRKRAMALTF
ncbi:MAG: MerR family transcriptional regulator [Deferribacteres bacterium]|nr:MerR family transcriptional regulator [candidate division KSB1 bacterium]MCB9511689.1 MerR family transcriptional regulator [Deferribacteres bacterium]